MSDVGDFVRAVRRVAAGGTVMDPEVVAALLAPPPADDPLARLTPAGDRGARADGRGPLQRRPSPAAWSITEKAVSKHTNNIFTKLDLWQDTDDNRRVLAVLDVPPGPGLSSPATPTMRDR